MFQWKRLSAVSTFRYSAAMIETTDTLPSVPAVIYHLCRAEEWAAAVVAGTYYGSSQDVADGFIHCSTAAQIRESAARHRAGQAGLVLLAVATAPLGAGLRWEPARNGQLFPHIYGPLPLAAVQAVTPLPVQADGRHRFPPLHDLDMP